MKKLLESNWIKITGILLLGILLGWWIKPEGQSDPHENHQHETGEETIWTCSMHPQIKLGEPGDCPICGMDLIPLQTTQSSAASDPLVLEMSPEGMALAAIQTSPVGGSSKEGSLSLTGKIQVDERKTTALSAKFPGRIEKLYVSFTGEQVKAGQKLARIYSPELMTAQQELMEAAKTKALFPELYAAAREKLRLWKLTETQIQNLESSGLLQEQVDIYAAHAGIVMERRVSVGDYVSTGSVLFELVDLSSLWVLLDAYESDLPFLTVGNSLEFKAAGIPGKTFKARITYIDPLIDKQTRVASIRAEVSNTRGDLKPEMFVTATIRTQPKTSTLLSIPRTALLWSGKRSIVYVKVPDTEQPSFEMREVQVGSRVGDIYTIQSGLEPGEEVVTNGAFSIDAAAQLAGKNSLVNRPNTPKPTQSEEFQTKLNGLADAYFILKNALAEDKLDVAKKSVAGIQKARTAVPMKTLEEPIHSQWMTSNQEMAEIEKMLGEATDLKAARKHFSNLSRLVLELTEQFGLGRVVYMDYCPMAFGNEGGYWLSEKKEIFNPYFGASMLRCGEVKKTFRE